MGWVHRRRDLGGVIFIHLRDREGVTQILFRQDAFPEILKKAETLGLEYVIAVEGVVESRSADTINPSIPTGEVEILCDKLWILNESRTPPFPMEDAVDRQRGSPACSTATSTCAVRGCNATLSCARRSRWRFARLCTISGSSKSRRRS